jgi:hypothetical protein
MLPLTLFLLDIVSVKGLKPLKVEAFAWLVILIKMSTRYFLRSKGIISAIKNIYPFVLVLIRPFLVFSFTTIKFDLYGVTFYIGGDLDR